LPVSGTPASEPGRSELEPVEASDVEYKAAYIFSLSTPSGIGARSSDSSSDVPAAATEAGPSPSFAPGDELEDDELEDDRLADEGLADTLPLPAPAAPAPSGERAVEDAPNDTPDGKAETLEPAAAGEGAEGAAVALAEALEDALADSRTGSTATTPACAGACSALSPKK
jgi:hypothetical protein